MMCPLALLAERFPSHRSSMRLHRILPLAAALAVGACEGEYTQDPDAEAEVGENTPTSGVGAAVQGTSIDTLNTSDLPPVGGGDTAGGADIPVSSPQ
jgi:hypothetical protein